MDDQLQPFLEASGVRAEELHHAELESITQAVGRRSPDEFIPAFVAAPTVRWTDGQVRPPGYLELHDADWSISLREPGNREHVLAVLIAGVLAETLDLVERVGWLVPLLPAVVEVVAVERTGAELRITLARRPDPELPAALADTVNALDFADLADAIRRAPRSTTLPSGVTVVFPTS